MARAPVLAAGGIVLRQDETPLIAVVRLRKRNEWVLPKGKLDDDWCQIEVIGKQDEYTVDSFEHSYADSVVKVTFHRNNGLDGKVSMIRVD